MASQRETGKSIKWLLSLFALLGLAMLAIPFLLTPPAFLYVELEDDAFTDSDFEGKTVELTNLKSQLSASAKIHKVEGAYLAKVGRIDSGKSDWQVEVNGYYPGEISVDIPPLEKNIAHVKLKPKFGRIKVLALNVLKKDTVIDSQLDLTVSGQKISGNAASDLMVSHLNPGEHTVKGEAEGYYPEEKKAEVKEAQTTEVRLGFSPKLKSNEVARIVLQWDKDPRDLDSHLFLPSYTGLNRRHIYYSYKKTSVNNLPAAVLDVDDTSSYGPETTTIYKIVNGLYRYAVYHYAGSGSIGGTSKAKIKVYTHNGIREYSAPTTCSQKWWYVINLEINGNNVRIIPKNECPTKMGWRIGKKDN